MALSRFITSGSLCLSRDDDVSALLRHSIPSQVADLALVIFQDALKVMGLCYPKPALCSVMGPAETSLCLFVHSLFVFPNKPLLNIYCGAGTLLSTGGTKMK